MNYKTMELDDILKLNISKKLKEEFKEKYHKKCYFSLSENTKIAKLVGLETNYQFSNLYYILADNEGNKYYVSVDQGITLL